MGRQIVLKQDILDALSTVGMRPGQTVMVHCSLSALGYVCGGAQSVIEALLQTVGEAGTIMMPTQSWKTWTRRAASIGRSLKNGGSLSVITGQPMTNASRLPIRWGPWPRCSARGRARFAATIRHAQWRQTASERSS